MNTSKFLSAVAVLGLAGTVGFAHAQTANTDTTDGSSNPTSTPDPRYPATTSERIVDGERRVDSAAQDAADTMENNPPAAGSTMSEEQVARADRN